MREQILFRELRRALAKTARAWFRLVHFSIQSDHIHLIVEAEDKASLSRGLTGLSVRLARAYNRMLGRRGKLWAERYHARSLKTPRETRIALVYVLCNWRKHHRSTRIDSASFDPCSSARWFVGWAHPPPCERFRSPLDAPVQPPQTWLARAGWRLHGLIGPEEVPAERRARR
jgi:hypothetical protein